VLTFIPTQSPAEKEIMDALSLLKKIPFQEIQRLGYHFQANDYYSPLNDCEFLRKNEDLWKNGNALRDIDWNLEGQMKVARMVGEFVDELRDVPLKRPEGAVEYCWDNHFWNSSDALVQYGILRGLKPGKVTEVGCGWSSLLMQRALEKNEIPCDVIQIEPYPNREIFKQLPAAWIHNECILQRAPMSAFERLQAGDICFYDGSHCAKTASDVNWFFFEILPRLAPGVVIHIHDIFLPEPYPDPWIFERGQTWNEQYILQAFLMHNHNYEIIMGNRYLWKQKAAFLDELYKGIQPSYGCSFWMKKIK
jgi:hypothetical protein